MVHKCFHGVQIVMMCFAKKIIVSTSYNAIANTSKRHRRLNDIFVEAICVLDITLMYAVVSVDHQTRYKGRRKCKCYQNIMGISDFGMIFTFV